MKIEHARNCNKVELGDIDYGSVIRHDGQLFLVTDEGGNNCHDFNCGDSSTLMVVSLETGNIIKLDLEHKFEIVKAKVVVE